MHCRGGDSVNKKQQHNKITPLSGNRPFSADIRRKTMGLNRKRGRIPNVIKEAAKQAVDEGGIMAYHYACYECAWECDHDSEVYKQQVEWDYPLIDCIVKEMKARGLW